MGRPLRTTRGGLAYHVLNRANARMRLFEDDGDYAAFERVIAQACQRVPMRILAYCLMPNHWHLLLWPRHDGDLSQFVRWLTLTHTQRWRAHQHSTGAGHVYQGRFKLFVVQTDEHLLTVCRYVERNALRAKLVDRVEDWRWGSLWQRQFRDAKTQGLLSPWLVERPRNWLEWVHDAETDAVLGSLRCSVNRGQPFGSAQWVARTVERLELASTLRPRGRPRKDADENGS